MALRPSVPNLRNRRLQVGKRKVQLLSAMDDYNRDATWKIIRKDAAQLLMSEDAFVYTNCAHRVKIKSDRVHHQLKIESDRVHRPFVSAAEKKEWEKLMVRRPRGSCLVPPAYSSEPYGAGSLLVSQESAWKRLPRPSLAESNARPVAPVLVVQESCCMQRLLLAGGLDLDFQDRCVPAPACPKFGFFSSSKS